MAKILAPDGTTIEFPDGTDDATIERVMQENYGGPTASLEQTVSAMTPQQQEYARVTDDGEVGNYLRSVAKTPKQGETPEQADQRLYGKPMQGPSPGLSRVAGAADTMSWGLGDEMAAGLEAVTGGRSYDQALANQRQMAETAQKDNPGDYLGGQIYGAVAPAVLTMGASAGPASGGLGMRMLQSGKVAGAGGSVYGFNSGAGGLLERAKNAGKNALFAGAVGLGGPVVGAAVGAGWRAVLGKLNASGIPAKTAETITDMLSKAGLTPQQASQKLNDLGPEGMLADLAQVEAAQTARATPLASSLMAPRVEGRRMNAGPRMATDLNKTLGPTADPFSVKQATKMAKGQIGPEYETAIANAPQLPKNLDTLLGYSLTDPASGLSMGGRKVMYNIMTDLEDALAADTPAQTASRLLNIRQGLDAQIVREPQAFMSLSSADKAAQATLKQAREVVDDILKNRIPGIAEADAKFAPLSRQQEAYDFGQKKLLRGGSGTVTPAELDAKLKLASPQERQMMTQGGRTEIDRTLSNARNNPGTQTDRILSRDWNGDKVESLIGTQRKNALKKAIDRENTFTETSNLIEPNRNSRTAVLQAPSRWDGSPGSGLLGDMGAAFAGGFGGGGVVSGLLASGSVGAKRLAGTMFKAGKVNEKLVAETADQLTKMGADAQQVVQGLLSIAATKQSNAAKAKAASDLITSLITRQAKVTSVNDPIAGGPYRSARGLLQ